jgi:hypothetical protein
MEVRTSAPNTRGQRTRSSPSVDREDLFRHRNIANPIEPVAPQAFAVRIGLALPTWVGDVIPPNPPLAPLLQAVTGGGLKWRPQRESNPCSGLERAVS